jgi:FkbM family methyltransferase
MRLLNGLFVFIAVNICTCVCNKTAITDEMISGSGDAIIQRRPKVEGQCKYSYQHFTNPKLITDICVALDPLRLKQESSIGLILERRGYLPTCRVMQIMLWMMATVSGGVLSSNLFVDVGANIGSCSVCMASFGMHTIAFEPFLAHVEIIHASKIQSHLNIHVHHGGVAATSTTKLVRFRHGSRNYGATVFETEPGIEPDTKNELGGWAAEDRNKQLAIYALKDVIPEGVEVRYDNNEYDMPFTFALSNRYRF